MGYRHIIKGQLDTSVLPYRAFFFDSVHQEPGGNTTWLPAATALQLTVLLKKIIELLPKTWPLPCSLNC